MTGGNGRSTMPTSVIVWSPFGELGEPDELKREMDQMFAELARETRTERDDDELVVRADAPAFKPEEIQVEFEGATLSVSG
jgi:HSP20 family molecular chaperone IbpA